MNTWQKRNKTFHDAGGLGRYAHPFAPPEGSPDSGESRGFSATLASRAGIRPKMLITLLYAVGALTLLLFIHGRWFEFTAWDVWALDRVVLAGGVLVGSAWYFPWHRFGNNVLLVPVFATLALITLAVYFSGGWQSPLSIFYLFVVVFCAAYLSLGTAALCLAVTLLVRLSPQLYAPGQAGLVEYLLIQAPAYAGLFLASRYVLWERTSLQLQRTSQRIRDLEERLWHEASLDPLTDLYNRGRFEARFEEEFERARRTGEQFMVLFVDVDDFKNVNDNHGHRMGDEALKLIAGILQSCSRRIDVVARHGGDEFMVMLQGASLEEAHRFFKRMREQVVERAGKALDLDLRLSAGAVQCPGNAKDPAALLEAADEAMYRAKRRGKDRMFVALSPAEHRRKHPQEE
jgi:diguanylate cyclase (GGDEF)-like protein